MHTYSVCPCLTWDLPHACTRRYEPLLGRVASYHELLDVMAEMQGELGASHAYVSPPEKEGGDAEGEQGSLGATCAWDEARGGWTITSHRRGDVWEPIFARFAT